MHHFYAWLLSTRLQSHNYAYDAATLQLNTETITNGTFTRTINRAYDALLRNSGVTVSVASPLPGGTPQVEQETTYNYDDAGRLATVAGIKCPLGASSPVADTFTYTYLPNSGNLIKTLAGPAHTVTNSYEAKRNVLTNKANEVGASNISTYAYTVNNLGFTKK